jgi:dolichol kinase
VPGLAELVARTQGLQPWRRVVHALTGLTLAYVPLLLAMPRPLTTTVLGAAVIVAFAADLVRLRVPRLNALFFRAFRTLASPREASRVASSTWFLLGGFLAWTLFPPALAAAALSVLALADPAASVVGRLLGRHRLGKGTVRGTVAFVTTAALVMVPQVGLGPALVAALVTGLAEVVPLPLDDNLTVPITCGMVLWGLATLPG